MSRLKPVFGGLAPAASRQQAASKQQQAFEQDNGQIVEKAHLIPRECVDASLQDGDLAVGLVACWHPKFPILAVATSTAVVEYDALSGCRRNFVQSTGSPVKLRYTNDGEHLILLTKERNIVSWSTSNWRRRALLTAEARYANRPLVSGLLTVSPGPQPVVYYSPMGKYTLRTVHMSAPQVPKGGKQEKEFNPGFKLKTENKKPIVGLTAHPFDRQVLFMLLVDGSFLVCGVSGGTLTTLCGLSVNFDATKERVTLHAVPHPLHAGATLVFVEAERSGLTILSVPSRNEVRVLSELSIGAGAVLAGAGLLHRSCLIVAAVRHAGGNVGIRAWRLKGDSRTLSLLPVTASPATVWDALQSDSATDGSSLADVSGEAVVAGMVPHGPSGLLAFWTARQDDVGAAHLRLPLLAMVDGEDPLEGLGAAKTLPLHTAPSFWTANGGHDGVVSKLRFPRYAHALNFGRVSSYDLTHGLLADLMVPPVLNAAGQERALIRVIRSPKQGLWLPFMQILSPGREGAPLGPGHIEFTAIPESEAAVSPGSWWLPGRDAVFVGGRDELLAILSNSGSLIAVFDTPKLTQQGGPRALYIAELKEGMASRVFPGPPSHIPAAPEPRPEAPEQGEEGEEDGEETDEEAEAALREWEESEVRRLELPRRMLLLTADNKLCLSDVSQAGLSYGNQTRSLAAKHSLKLRLSEAVVQVAWQTLLDPAEGFHAGCEGADTALPCAAAVLTTERCLLVDDRLNVLAAVPFAGDVGMPTSALWVGPALILTTSTNQVIQVRWDGQADHLASLLSGPPVVLLAAMADRLVLAARGDGPGLMAGKTETATRGFSVLPPMLVGWAGAAARGVLPGGSSRARREMRTLLASYDASQLPVFVLDAMATAGFADVAAAAAARSELPAVTPARRAVLAAAAGDWSAVVDLVETELEASEWAPNRPPKGSALYKKVVALARACEAYGRFVQARELFAAAGAWNELLALCIFQGDFSAAQSYARLAGNEVVGLADQLAAVNENTFMRLSSSSAFGGRPNIEDWNVQVGDAVDINGSFLDKKVGGGTADGTGLDGEGTAEDPGMDLLDMELEVAPAGRLPFMEASLLISAAAAASGIIPPEPQGEDAEEGQPIAQLDLNTLETYLGVSGATVLKEATTTPGVAAAAAAISAMPSLLDRTETSNSTDLGAATAAAVMAGTPRGPDGASMPDSEADASAAAAAAAARGETLAQSAARAAFKRDAAASEDDADSFFSSDEESNAPDAEARSSASFAATTSSKFLINIRSPGAGPGENADGASLRAAAMSLKLGGPGGEGSMKSARSGGLVPPPSQPSTSRRSLSEDEDGSSVSSLEMDFDHFGPGHKAPAIATPPPAPPLPRQEPAAATSDDPFAAFADLGGAAGPFASASGTAAKDTTSALHAKEGKEEESTSTTADKASSTSGPMVSKDPFAGLPGLPPTLSQAVTVEPKQSSSVLSLDPLASGPMKAPLAEAVFSQELPGAPMRPQEAPPVPQSDLLSGWDAFEALFGGPAAAPADAGTAATPLEAATSGTAAAAGATLPSGTQQPESTASAAAAPQLTSAPVGPVPPPSSLKKVYTKALSSFRQGQWGPASENLGKSLDGAVKGHKDPATAEAFRQQCAYLYAAATLISRSAAAPPQAASRLSRFAAALPLGEEQRAVTTAFAVEANMAAGNYGWAGDQLTWLVVVASEGEVGGPGLETAQLAERLAACDRANGRDAAMPADEDTESFAAIVGSCESKRDVDELLSNLVQG